MKIRTYGDIGNKIKEMDASTMVKFYDYLDSKDVVKQIHTKVFNAMHSFKNGKSPAKLFKNIMADLVVGFECHEWRKEQEAE